MHGHLSRHLAQAVLIVVAACFGPGASGATDRAFWVGELTATYGKKEKVSQNVGGVRTQSEVDLNYAGSTNFLTGGGWESSATYRYSRVATTETNCLSRISVSIEGKGQSRGDSKLQITIDDNGRYAFDASFNDVVGTQAGSEKSCEGKEQNSQLPFAWGGVGARIEGKSDTRFPDTLVGEAVLPDPLHGAGGPLKVTWSLNRVQADIQAVIRALGAAQERGQKLVLSGAASKGSITSYEWLFTIDPSCGAGAGAQTRMTGEKVEFTALCDFDARLTVSDGKGRSNGTSKKVIVLARAGKSWQTRFSSKLGPPLTSRVVAEFMQLGLNQCARHAADETSGHIIHTDAPNTGTWSDSGYTRAQVNDAGPFNGMWHVQSQSLEIARVERVNASLQGPEGELYKLNQSRGNLRDLNDLLAQVSAHERAHSMLMANALRDLGHSGDPALRIESLVRNSADALASDADFAIRDVETLLRDATSEEPVKKVLRSNPAFQREVRIWVPTLGGSVLHKFFGPLWNVGD